MPPPVVYAITPNTQPAAGGGVAQMVGAYFDATLAVTVGGTSSALVEPVSQFLAQFRCPVHAAGTLDVVATTGGGSVTKTGGLTYIPLVAAITTVSPASGPAAGSAGLTIRGSNFVGATGVTVGGVAATGFLVNDIGTITCLTGAHAVGLVNVVVLHPNGNATAANAYTYV